MLPYVARLPTTAFNRQCLAITHFYVLCSECQLILMNIDHYRSLKHYLRINHPVIKVRQAVYAF